MFGSASFNSLKGREVEMKLFNLLVASLLMISWHASPSTATAQVDDQKSIPTSTKTRELPEHLRTGPPKSIEEVRLFEDHIQQLLKKISPATVNVGGGTGVVVSEEGLILTVQHVNRTAGRGVTVTFPDGKRVKAITLGGYQGVDGGMMKITDEGKYPFAKMGDSSKLKKGQWCLALGYPVSFSKGQEPAVRLGRVLRTSSTTVMTDCTIMGGDSGGPLFDLDGNVIGIHSRVNGDLARNIHVPINIYSDNWDRFLASEEWSSRRPAYLGVRRAEGEDRPLVMEVIKGTAAERAGVKAGDLITEFGGKKVSTFDELLKTIKKYRPGQRVTIKVMRDGEIVSLRVRLGTEAPQPRK